MLKYLPAFNVFQKIGYIFLSGAAQPAGEEVRPSEGEEHELRPFFACSEMV